jgi:hypothetical protein
MAMIKEIVDLSGSSGRNYRFRIWPDDAAHIPIAGNYAFLRVRPGGYDVLFLGQTNDLSGARSRWPLAQRKGATHLYTRLNVSGSVRRTEHEDLMASYSPPLNTSLQED